MLTPRVFLVTWLFSFAVDTTANSGPIIPGTKWCGDGDIAQNYSDLGRYPATDKCCQAHDFCPDIMKAGTSKYGLTNNSTYTRLHCQCDGQFYHCLKAARDGLSTLVLIYFDKLEQLCYVYRHPATCTSYTWDRKGCYRYKYDTSQPKKWQWFDVLYYTVAT